MKDLFNSKIRNKYERNSACPCGSNLKAKRCCLQNDGSWNKTPSNIAPPIPFTNFSNIKCYCSSTNNCDSKITKEHYISRSVIRNINNNGKDAVIAGLPWIASESSKTVSVESLTAKTLCKRHNNSFSPLDSAASQLFGKIDDFDRKFLNADKLDEISIFCGEDVEKWMLKTVCGFVSAKQIGTPEKLAKTSINPVWIEILCGKRQWPKNWGLYINVKPGEEILHTAKTFSFIPILDPENDELLAAEILINNISFVLLLDTTDNPDFFGVYRPRTLMFYDGTSKKYIELSWQDKSHRKFILFNRKGTHYISE